MLRRWKSFVPPRLARSPSTPQLSFSLLNHECNPHCPPQIFMFSSAFAVAAPIILPCAWFFFLTGFFAYRYSLLYIYERSYESGACV